MQPRPAALPSERQAVAGSFNRIAASWRCPRSAETDRNRPTDAAQLRQPAQMWITALAPPAPRPGHCGDKPPALTLPRSNQAGGLLVATAGSDQEPVVNPARAHGRRRGGSTALLRGRLIDARSTPRWR
jgi:hypothetical protein